MSDEGFHEIQLGGKQLVFLFMAAAVVGVVLFLSGVMVGRGVRNEKAAMMAQGPAAPVVDLAPAGAEPAPPAVSGPPQAGPPSGDQGTPQAGAPPATPPPPVADDIQRAARPEAPAAVGKPAGTPALTPGTGAAPARGRQPDVKPAPAAPPTRPAPVATVPPRVPAGPAGTFSVQVAAPRDRASATAIAKRLVARGYAAYVVEPIAGSAAPAYYRVRVGPFKSRGEADEARRRLEKEEQFKPFVTTR
jgi:cell division septation protein DedD